MAGSIRKLTSILTTPGFTDERIHLFLATDLTEGATGRDDDEFMEIVVLPFSEVRAMAEKGEIVDAKTLCCVLYAATFLRPG